MSIVQELEAAGEVLSPAVRAAVVALETEKQRLKERVRELEARLGLNSTNSSKPPSSDPPHVRRRFSAEYMLRIVQEADACTEPGEIGALLRCAERAEAELDRARKVNEVQENVSALLGELVGPRGETPDKSSDA